MSGEDDGIERNKLQFIGWAAVSVIVLLDWVKHGGLGGGVGNEHTGTRITLDR